MAELILAGASAAVTGAGHGIGRAIAISLGRAGAHGRGAPWRAHRHGQQRWRDWIGPFHEEPDEVTRREIEINLYGTTLGSKLALARMLPRRFGHVVNIASGAGRVPLPGTSTYSATKHGVVELTESPRIAGDLDVEARRAYHRRAFGRD